MNRQIKTYLLTGLMVAFIGEGLTTPESYTVEAGDFSATISTPPPSPAEHPLRTVALPAKNDEETTIKRIT